MSRLSRVLLSILACLPFLASAQTLTGTVVGVKDGDTVELLVQERSGPRSIRVRLHGIDAPESNQPFGQASKKWLSDRVFKKTIAAEVRDTDRYGRTVAVLKVGDREVNVESVRAGMSWWYRQFARKDAALERAESEARAARRGLWSEPGAIAPWEFRRGGKSSAGTVGFSTASSSGRSAGGLRSVGGYRPPPSLLAISRTVYVTVTGEKHHADGCQYLRRSRIPMKLVEARKRYDACSVCGGG